MNNGKIFTIFAGCNGSGKSTLYHSLLAKENFGVRLNSDELIRERGALWTDPNAQIEAGRILLEKQEECLQRGKSFNRETTLSGREIIKTVQRAKLAGFYINMFYVGVANAEIAKQRVAKRVSQGGHGIDNDTIERRYKSSLSNLVTVIPFCDNVSIYDNSTSRNIELINITDGRFIYKQDAETDLPQWAKKILSVISANIGLSDNQEESLNSSRQGDTLSEPVKFSTSDGDNVME